MDSLTNLEGLTISWVSEKVHIRYREILGVTLENLTWFWFISSPEQNISIKNMIVQLTKGSSSLTILIMATRVIQF